jgi:hypothetical protein
MSVPNKTHRQRVLLEVASRKRVLIEEERTTRRVLIDRSPNPDPDPDPDLHQDPPTRSQSGRVLLQELPLPVYNFSRGKDIRENGVSKQEENFLQHWVTHYSDPKKSAIAVGYPAVDARRIAFRLLSLPRLVNRLAEIERDMLASVRIDPHELFKEVVTQNLRLARAKVPMQVWNPCCRHCYGINHMYQRTYREFEEDYERSVTQPVKPKMGQSKPLPFDEKGGSGYDPSLPPDPDCPNCHGDGDAAHPVVRVKDTRLFTPEERELFAGAIAKRSGVEMVWKDQAQAREFLNDLALRMTEYTKPVDEPVDISEMSVTQLRQLLEFAKEQGFDVDLEALDTEVDGN